MHPLEREGDATGEASFQLNPGLGKGMGLLTS